MIVSFDDFYINDQNNLDRLFYLKGKYKHLKVNFFCVPKRSTWEWLSNFKLPWIGLYMHGWKHERGEEIQQRMVTQWVENMGTKVYKSPWYDDKKEQLDLLHANGFKLVTYPVKVDHPITQVILGKNDFRGHVWKDEDWDKLSDICEHQKNFELI